MADSQYYSYLVSTYTVQSTSRLVALVEEVHVNTVASHLLSFNHSPLAERTSNSSDPSSKQYSVLS